MHKHRTIYTHNKVSYLEFPTCGSCVLFFSFLNLLIRHIMFHTTVCLTATRSDNIIELIQFGTNTSVNTVNLVHSSIVRIPHYYKHRLISIDCLFFFFWYCKQHSINCFVCLCNIVSDNHFTMRFVVHFCTVGLLLQMN